MHQMRFITQVLLPKYDNLGLAYPPELFRAFQRRMMRRYAGWTRKGQAEGAWLGPAGDLYIDRHWVYEVTHARRDSKFWRREKERLKWAFDQEEIWIIQYQGRQI